MTNTSQRRALVVQSNTPFGNKLIQSGYINPEQLQQAIKTARPGQPLTEILESITGQPLPPELARQYKKQQLFELRIIHGVEAYDPEIEPMTTEELEAMLKFLETSLETCKRHRFIPLRKVESDPSSVLIAMVDPDNLTALEELRNQILRPQALKLQRRVITHEDYDQIISAYSDEDVKRKAVEAAIRDKEKLDFTAGDFDTTDLEDMGDEGGGMDLADEIEQSETAPVIKAVNVILAKALSEGVSDIHVEPQEHEMRIRMRRDGVLEEYYKFPKKVIPAITSRFKILAEMDIAERRQAQDGRIRRKFRDGRSIFG